MFRKRISKYFPLPLSFIIFTILSIIIVVTILIGAKSYISDFSQEKWNCNERLRIYMIDDLEEGKGILGKIDKEIIDLLGEPIYISDTKKIIYEYYVGESMIDPYSYQIEFENNVAVNTALVNINF